MQTIEIGDKNHNETKFIYYFCIHFFEINTFKINEVNLEKPNKSELEHYNFIVATHTRVNTKGVETQLELYSIDWN